MVFQIMTVYMLLFFIGIYITISEGKLKNKSFLENTYGDVKRQLLNNYFKEISLHSFLENSGNVKQIHSKNQDFLKIFKGLPITNTREQTHSHLMPSREVSQAVKTDIPIFSSVPSIKENRKLTTSVFSSSNSILEDKNRYSSHPDIRRYNPKNVLQDTLFNGPYDYLAGAGVPFIIEGSEIGDAAYIIPDIKEKTFTLPSYEPPRRTYKLTINDGWVKRNEIRKDNGEFISSYSSVDGTRRSDQGELVRKANGDQVLVLRGSYSFTTPEGLKFRVDYTADQFGYHATQVLL